MVGTVTASHSRGLQVWKAGASREGADKKCFHSQKESEHVERLRTAGLGRDVTMKNPGDTVRETRCVSSCTRHTQCLCFHEIQR